MNSYEKYLQYYKNFFRNKEFFIDARSGKEISAEEALGEFTGIHFTKYLTRYIKTYIKLSGKKSITVLDYGCGRGHMPWRPHKEYKFGVWGYFKDKIQAIWLYDPANPNLDTKPPKNLQFDVVGCAEVMEHVPEEHVDAVLTEIDSYTKPDGIIMITTCNILALKELPNGENVHITVRDRAWWVEKLLKNTKKQFILNHFQDKKSTLTTGNLPKGVSPKKYRE